MNLQEDHCRSRSDFRGRGRKRCVSLQCGFRVPLPRARAGEGSVRRAGGQREWGGADSPPPTARPTRWPVVVDALARAVRKNGAVSDTCGESQSFANRGKCMWISFQRASPARGSQKGRLARAHARSPRRVHLSVLVSPASVGAHALPPGTACGMCGLCDREPSQCHTCARCRSLPWPSPPPPFPVMGERGGEGAWERRVVPRADERIRGACALQCARP